MDYFSDRRSVQPLVTIFFAGKAESNPEPDVTGMNRGKLIRSMVAAETTGGDKRGTCSAALMTERSDGYRLDLRVDYSNQPIDDLNELLKKMRSDDANNFLNRIPTRRFPYKH